MALSAPRPRRYVSSKGERREKGERMVRVKRLAAATMVATGLVLVVAPGSASAAGGTGASLCSFATGPSGLYDLGADLRSHQPFNGDTNPGFAGPGFSPFCQP